MKKYILLGACLFLFGCEKIPEEVTGDIPLLEDLDGGEKDVGTLVSAKGFVKKIIESIPLKKAQYNCEGRIINAQEIRQEENFLVLDLYEEGGIKIDTFRWYFGSGKAAPLNPSKFLKQEVCEALKYKK